MLQENNGNQWSDWSKHVLYQLEQANKDRDALREEIKKMHDDILTFKVQAGAISVIATFAVSWIVNHFK